jgi:hypothetical protein
MVAPSTDVALKEALRKDSCYEADAQRSKEQAPGVSDTELPSITRHAAASIPQHPLDCS